MTFKLLSANVVEIQTNLVMILHDALFDLNDESTRNQSKEKLENILEFYGIEATVKCDSENNTPDIVDKHGFVIDVMDDDTAIRGSILDGKIVLEIL